MTSEKTIETMRVMRVFYNNLESKQAVKALDTAIDVINAWDDVVIALNKYTQKLVDPDGDQNNEFEHGIKKGIDIALEEIYKRMPKEEQDVH